MSRENKSNFLERMRNLDSEQASLNEKVNVLEEQLTTNKNRFEQKLQEMVCVSEYYFVFTHYIELFLYSGGPEQN